jgi:hypothetical protein
MDKSESKKKIENDDVSTKLKRFYKIYWLYYIK